MAALILPSLTLGAAVAAVMARFTARFVCRCFKRRLYAYREGERGEQTWVVLKHGLRNAMIPVVTMMGLQFGFLLGGSPGGESFQLARTWTLTR